MLKDRLYSKIADDKVYLFAMLQIPPFRTLQKLLKSKERRREDV